MAFQTQLQIQHFATFTEFAGAVRKIHSMYGHAQLKNSMQYSVRPKMLPATATIIALKGVPEPENENTSSFEEDGEYSGKE